MKLSIYTIASPLHDKKSTNETSFQFLKSLNIEHEYKGNNFSDYGSSILNLIYIQTGGTEGIFKSLLPQLIQQSSQPFYLLTSGKSNSLAASMEILSYLRQNNLKGEILHGESSYITRRIHLLMRVNEAKQQLKDCKLGIIGKPSDWLISSNVDKQIVKDKLGINLIDIPIEKVIDICKKINVSDEEKWQKYATSENIKQALSGANKIYFALKEIIEEYNLQGFTIRCFDLLPALNNTGCLALARINAEGIVAGCEGDVPAMLSMKITHALTGITGFQANPSNINPITGQILFAHCTIPFNMIERFEFLTHFESGIGIGIRGYMKKGPITIFKVNGNMDRYFAEEGELLQCEDKPNLCRTQQLIQLSPETTQYFLTNPIGNHHIVVPSHCKQLITQFFQ